MPGIVLSASLSHRHNYGRKHVSFFKRLTIISVLRPHSARRQKQYQPISLLQLLGLLLSCKVLRQSPGCVCVCVCLCLCVSVHAPMRVLQGSQVKLHLWSPCHHLPMLVSDMSDHIQAGMVVSAAFSDPSSIYALLALPETFCLSWITLDWEDC